MLHLIDLIGAKLDFYANVSEKNWIVGPKALTAISCGRSTGATRSVEKKNGWALVKTYAIFWYTFFSREFHYTDLFVKGKQLISFLLKEFHEFLFWGLIG